MKKLVLLLIVPGLMAISCAKDWTCDCTLSHSKNDTLVTTTKTTIVKASKSQAKANCISTKRVSTDTVYTKACTLH